FDRKGFTLNKGKKDMITDVNTEMENGLKGMERIKGLGCKEKSECGKELSGLEKEFLGKVDHGDNLVELNELDEEFNNRYEDI
ncbi:hypothetical protein, partial [Staphylococcus epidermidis]|uniref:hypothetical protein n=1 Tax=Staphylococcus epidermidis TaxID=1282 RepID=UPI00164296FE